MAAVNQDIVREFFEMHGFLVRQDRKYVLRGKTEDDGIDFLVWNPKKREGTRDLPFVLASEDMDGVERALVVVRGWHTEVFSAAVLENSPEIFRFVTPALLKQALQSFGLESEPMKILVVPALPSGAEAKEEAIKMLREKGINAVIPFRTILANLIARIETNRNYDKSDVLQVIRVLKNYKLFKEPQLELFKATKTRRKNKGTAESETNLE
ncbi:MAG: hypothetical protein JWO95_1923 [Verrucomicrobiales bacterium]|nr:hypothetical protein [Verrucomicrobiales bacterium]